MKKLKLIWQIIIGNYEPITRNITTVKNIIIEDKYNIVRLRNRLIIPLFELEYPSYVQEREKFINKKIIQSFANSEDFIKAIKTEEILSEIEQQIILNSEILILQVK